MRNPTRTWQLINFALAVALIPALIKLHSSIAANLAATGTLPIGNSATSLEHLALSPNARRVHERYSP